MREKEHTVNIHICSNRTAKPHMHDCLELAYVLHGSAVHKFNQSKKEIISKGDYFIIDYRTVHSYQSRGTDDFSVINLLFLPQLIDKSLAYCKDFQTLLRHYLIQIGDQTSPLRLSNRIFHDDDGKVQTVLCQMLAEYEEKSTGWYEVMRSEMVLLLITTARKLSHKQERDIVSDIQLRVHQNYNQNLTLGALAAELHYSLPYISKLFKEKTGMTFRDYLQKTRMEEACRLIRENNDKFYLIGSKVGYPDAVSFARVFKEEMGCTPSEYRSMHASGEES